MRLMELFSVAQAEAASFQTSSIKWSARTCRLWAGLPGSPDAGRAFTEILRNKDEPALRCRMMYETGFLGRFLPEFRPNNVSGSARFHHTSTR